ncbi:acyl-CoA dehydrogenase family protein [Rhodovibrionaceae bacterium A322]
MDFDYSDRCQEMLSRVNIFMEEHIIPRIAQHKAERAEGVFPVSFMEDLKALAKSEGLWNLFLKDLRPDEPGTGLSNLDYAPLAELMGRVNWASEVFNCSAPDTGNMELLHLFATPDQYETWLKPLLHGEIRSSFAMTEPDVASSDATNIQTSIRREGDDYVINGRKWFITNAMHPNCKIFILMGKTDPEAETYRQQSMVLIPRDTPGVTIERSATVLNHHAPHGHCEIRFRDVRVPAENLLGKEGDGFAMAQARLGPGRIHHCMRSIGQMELALGLMCERALERKAFGRLLRDHGTVSEGIAQCRMEIDQARLLVLKTASIIDKQGASKARKEVSMIKATVAGAHCRVADRAIQVFGAMGLSQDTPLADIYTQGRTLRFADGPDEVHLRRIAKMETEEKAGNLGYYSRFLTPPVRT